MAVEMHVMFAGKLPSNAALTRAMKELGFPVSIPAGGGALDRQRGFLPMTLRGQKSGVEFDVYDKRAHIEEVAGEDFDPRFERAVSFRWGAAEDEMLCALCTAAALAKLVDGVVLDEEGSLSVEQAIEQARRNLDSVKPPDPRYGTRPADIKRYLKPLLELRGDLVVVGRMLLIRPVRHLLRGAFFDRTSDKYRFSITGYVQPLYGSPISVGLDTSFKGAPNEVWQPHFSAQLFDSLASDLFARWGPVTTLDGFANALIAKDGIYRAPILCLVLAGEWERAAEYVERSEREVTHEREIDEIKKLWEHVTTDIDGVCAKLHEWEAETVKALKLERIWEPSPFPVELPASERSRLAEPPFLPTPWIPSPSGLWQELPTQPGEVRFAKQYRHGKEGLILPAALSPEEAKERHEALEDYVMVARLANGLLLKVAFSGWDRNNPEVRTYVSTWTPRASLHIELHGASHFAAARASPDWDRSGVVELWSIDVFEWHPRRCIWHCFIGLEKGEKAVHDLRSGERKSTRSAPTVEERALVTLPIPSFGEYAPVAARLQALLRILGYGEFK
jgi:hypothetical protein